MEKGPTRLAERLAFSPKRLRDIRRWAGLDQRDIGDALGVAVQTVRDWEAGRSRPRGRNLRKLMALLETIQRASA